jgi:uncharacterized protein YegL
MEAFNPQHGEYADEAQLAQRVARVFGYEGLDIQVKPGAGWQTIKEEDRVTLVVDPSMLQPEAIKDAIGEDLPAGANIPQQYSVYGIAHELGHVEDFMQPTIDLEALKTTKPSEHFFWNVLDDAVINRRLRNIPLLNNLTDEVYKDMLFPKDDFSSLPKHVQFMYGWLLRNVTPDRQISLSDDVANALDNLEAKKIGVRRYDLPRTLAHPDTDFEKRREIASTHVLPIYSKFLEEDRQDRSKNDQQADNNQDSQSNPTDETDGSGSEQPQDSNQESKHDSSQTQGDGQKSQYEPDQVDSTGSDSSSNEKVDEPVESNSPTSWEDIYDAYSDVSHCSHQEHENHSHDNDDSSGDTDPHEAIREAAEALKEVSNATEDGNENSESESSARNSEAGSVGAGSIAAELELSPEDAAAYQAVVEQYRQQIREIAKVFQQLTVPSVEYISPRYQRRSDTTGLRLSPKDLFQVVVAQHSEVDPAVWKPVETISKREGFSFNGLDIHVVVDSSGSMQGAKADSAAACSVMLMEGLASARRMVERHNPRAPKPDVRLQVMLFGSSAKIVAPLNHETNPKDKGIAFTTVREARSGSTLVAEALKQTIDDGHINPERTQLVYLITDGDIHDRSAAAKVLEDAGRNYFLYQYILQSATSQPITTQASHISDPLQLPASMNTQLRGLASKLFG